jgi:hypothetical protein
VRGLSAGNQRNMETGAALGAAEMAAARRERDTLRAVLAAALRRFPVLALPTLAFPPPGGEEALIAAGRIVAEAVTAG